MNFRGITARFALVAACVLMGSTPAAAQFWQCAPYARTISGINIHGNAHTWWAQAAGRYARGNKPKVGAVLSLQSSGRMRLGHVAMVSGIVSDREVTLTHANWSRRGGIERDVRAVDVSAAGDWSLVKVWFAANRDLGTTAYPANGFIYSDGAKGDTSTSMPPVTMAANDAPVGVLSLVDRVAF